MKLSEIGFILAKYSLPFQNLTWSKELTKVWYELFTEETTEHFHAALSAALRKPNQQFFPTPGEVQHQLNILKNKHFPPAGLIWERLVEYAQCGFDHCKVLQLLENNIPAKLALRQVGWQSIRLSNIETELPWRKKDFESFYQTACENFEEINRVAISDEQAKAILSQIPGADKIKALN